MKTAVLIQNFATGERSLKSTFHSDPQPLTRPELLDYVSYGHSTVKSADERWQEITGQNELMQQLTSDPTTDDRIADLERELQRYYQDLTRLSRHNGEYRMIQDQISAITATIAELQAESEPTRDPDSEPETEPTRDPDPEPTFVVCGNVILEAEPEPSPEPEYDEPEPLKVVDLQAYTTMCTHIERMMQSFKGDGRLRTNYKVGNTCYKWLGREYRKALNIIDYSSRMARLADLEAEAYCRRVPRMDLTVTDAELDEAKRDVSQFER